MTIEERYQLSCYEEVSKLHEEKDIWLVRYNEDDNFYVKKRIALYNKSVYLRLMQGHYANVPEIIMCVEDEGTLIVIEEYIHGVSLEKQMERDGVFETHGVLEIMMHLCDILYSLHKSCPPIVHRDIKPSNIMKSSDGVIKLIDFNAAKEFMDGREEDTRLMGTRKFAAPEQYGFGQSDPRTDIYALGVTMYYLRYMDFPKDTELLDEFGKIVKRCIALDKNDRYQTVEDLKQDLERVLQDSTTINTPGENKPKRKKNPFFAPIYKRKNFLPIGFRSGILWKMICACYGYAYLFWLSFNTDVHNAEGEAFTGYPLWANRIAIFIILLGGVFFLGNYRNIRYELPFMRKGPILHWVFAALYYIIFVIGVIILLVLLGGSG